ncbi:hypothetical protein SESBI_41103 [Sesbania bispinosa]|nr:hypothetical protein SESBI_41103 [Sesbania bispinosa]
MEGTRQKDGTPPGGLSPEEEDNLARSNKKAKVQEVVEVSQEDTVVMETPMDVVDANHEGSPQQDKQRNVDELKRVAVWIRVPGLPMEYYDRNILWRIGDTLGKTQAGDGDLNQPKKCAENITPADDGGKSHKDVQGRGRVVYGEEGTNDAFGPWMLVQKPVRKRQNSTKKTNSVTAKDTCGTNMVVANDRQSYGSRFDALAQNMDVEEEVQHVEHPTSVTIHQQKDPSNRAAQIEGPKTVTQIKNKARSSAPEKSQNGPQFTSPNQHKVKPTQSFNFHQNPKPMEIIPLATVVLNKDSHGLFVSNVPSTSDPHKDGPRVIPEVEIINQRPPDLSLPAVNDVPHHQNVELGVHQLNGNLGPMGPMSPA